MRLYGTKALETQRTETLNLTVHHPVTNKVLHGIKIDKLEAQEAIDWLREHNGHAPEFVHALIDGMEIALTLTWER